jgi:hypothetical protein
MRATGTAGSLNRNFLRNQALTAPEALLRLQKLFRFTCFRQGGRTKWSHSALHRRKALMASATAPQVSRSRCR